MNDHTRNMLLHPEDQNLMAQIVLTYDYSHDYYDVVEEALKKITNQDILNKIMMKADPWIRKIAVKKITDQSFLTILALNELDFDVRIIAVRKITDQKILEKLAMDENFSVSFSALNRLIERDRIVRVARSSGLAVRIRCFFKLLPLLEFSPFKGKTLKNPADKAKQISKSREVPPLLLVKLNRTLDQWGTVLKESKKAENTLADWEKKYILIQNDINSMTNLLKEASDDIDVQEAYKIMLDELLVQQEEIKKTIAELEVLFSEAVARKESCLNVFAEAEKMANVYKNFDEVSKHALEHQADIKGLLEKTSSLV